MSYLSLRSRATKIIRIRRSDEAWSHRDQGFSGIHQAITMVFVCAYGRLQAAGRKPEQAEK